MRRALILRILGERPVRRQSELVALLRAEGLEATQSSVSRDLRELGVAKAGDRYLPPGAAAQPRAHFEEVAAFVQGYRSAGPYNLVLRTCTGAAQSVAVAIDQAAWPEVVGTLSGDDTIFIATDSPSAQRELMRRLRKAFPL